MTPELSAEFEALLLEVINTSFDCGEWDDDVEPGETYAEAYEKVRRVSKNLRAFVERNIP